MKDIQNEEWLDSLTDALEKRLSDLNSYIVSIICKRVGQIATQMKEGKTSDKTATEYALQDMAKVKKRVESTRKYAQKDIDTLFNRLAAANVEFANDYYEYREMPKIEDYTKNSALKRIVDSLKKASKEGFANISKTTAIGMTDKNGKFKSIRQTYVRTIDDAIQAVKLGEKDFYTTMRSTVKQLAKSGVRVEFESGYTRRLDSQATMNIQDGVRELNHQMQEQVGKEFDADGWEISVHALCAPDHQDIQGKQYSKKEYERLNRRLERPIGEMNCRHYATPIILGVSKPVYSDKELREYNNRSNEKVSYKGKEYTRYEASQMQRKYETAIRQARLEQQAAKDATDTEEANRQKTRVTLLMSDYKRFSKSVGLTARPERTYI